MSSDRDGGLGCGFGKLWAASTCSALGDGVIHVAGALIAASLTQDPMQVAGLMIAHELPRMLLALPSGVVVDWLDRRRLMTAAGLARVAASGVLGLAIVVGQVSLPLLYAVFFLVGCAGLVFENASTAVLPALVLPIQLELANGRLQAAKTLSGGLAAPPVGSWLFALAGWIPFLLDAGVSVLVTALSAMLPRTVNIAPAGKSRTSMPAAITEGVRWLLRQRLLRTLSLTVCLSNVGLGAVSSILVLIARERLGVGSVGYGLLFTALAVGGIIGGLLASRVVTAVGPGTALRAGLVIEMLTHLGLALTRSAVTAAALLALMGLHLVVFSTIGASLRQALVPPAMLGRVHSAYRLVTNAGMLLGATVGGVLGRYLGLAAPFWLGLACVAILTVCAWRVLDDRDIRTARQNATARERG